MKRILLFVICLLSLTGSAFTQDLRTGIKYEWNKVKDIQLHYSPDQNDYCTMDKLRDIVKDSLLIKPCKWTEIFDLIKVWNNEGPDVALEKECIAIEVDFGEETIAFAVFIEQGILFDLTENTFQYLNIPNKEEFKRILEKCIE